MRSRIEAMLGRWGLFVAQHALVVATGTVLATGIFAIQLQHFRLDTSLESYFHAEDPVRQQYDAFRDLFGRDAMIVVALKPRGGVFQAGFLEELRTIHEEIEEEVPLLVEVTSLVNVRETLGTEDGLEVGDFLADWPQTDEEIRAIEARAIANPLYRDFVISKDGRTTSIALEIEAFVEEEALDSLAGFEDANESESTPRKLTSGDDDARVVRALKSVLSRHQDEDLEIYLAGIPALNADLAVRIGHDMAVFTGLSIMLVGVFLAILFRRVTAVVLPLVAVILSVVSTLALMAATNTPLMPPTQIIPSFLLAVGTGGAVHLLTIFYQAQRRGDSKEASIAYALSHSGLPIIMTSVTTAAGLVSFTAAALRPIAQFGWITPVGVLLALFYVMTLLPALMALLPMRIVDTREEDTRSQRTLIAVGRFSTKHGRLVLLAWALLMAISVAGLFRVRLGHDMIMWFPPEDPMRQSIGFLNDELGGAVTFELLVSAGSENALHDPELLQKLEEIHHFTEGFEHTSIRASKVFSLVDVVKETHRALNENREDFYVIPESRELISQELLLFENSGSDDVEDLVTSQFDVGRVTVRVRFVDGAYYVPFIDAYLPRVREILGPDYSVVLTGAVPLMGHTITAALATMVRSYASAFIVITLLMIGLIGSLRLGLLSMIPNLAPVVFALGLMGWLDVPLDMLTLMLGSIVLGLAVDDTIHFMHSFRREIESTGDALTAVTNTLRGTGQALLFTSCVLVGGFLVYTQAYMVLLFDFGILVACAIVMAFLADVTLVPAMVSRVAWNTPATKS